MMFSWVYMPTNIVLNLEDWHDIAGRESLLCLTPKELFPINYVRLSAIPAERASLVHGP